MVIKTPWKLIVETSRYPNVLFDGKKCRTLERGEKIGGGLSSFLTGRALLQ